jgi:hypothetical protein
MTMKLAHLLAGTALLLAGGTGCATVPQAAAQPPVEVTATCGAVDGFGSVCGLVGTEDIVAVPGGRWLLASGMDLGKGGHLYWIDQASGRSFVAWPGGDAGPSEHCGGAPGAAFSTTGLAMDGGRLLAVNGGRKAIEMFSISGGKGDHPRLHWDDCAQLGAEVVPNGVVRMHDGTLVVSSFFDANSADHWDVLERGAPIGKLIARAPGGAFTTLDLGAISGPNGLATSADGKVLYVSEWGAGQVLVVEGLHRVSRRIPLPFRPDNIHVLPDGRLLVAGQDASPRAVGQCGAQCPQRWLVARVDPKTGTAELLVDRAGTVQANYATTALPVRGKIYISVRGDNRVLVLDAVR